MPHLQAAEVSLAYADRDILDEVSIALSSGDRCALAGANGSGKSTLMKILAGIIQPDAGSVVASAAARVVYLPQSGVAHSGRTVRGEIELAWDQTATVINERDSIAEQMQSARAGSAELDALLYDHHDLQERIESSGYYDRDAEIDRVLCGLGFRREDFARPVAEFSGGWQMRIALAQVLLRKPDFLLLDEPTNYLDVEARVWLGGFLASYPGGVLIVSHDRRFLDQTINAVWELFLARVKRYPGTYSDYERLREQEIAQLTSAWQAQQEEIRRLEDFIRRFRATASKARQVQSRVKELEKMERISLPEHLKRVSISFPQAPRSGREVVTVDSVSREYRANRVLHNVNMVIERGERVVLVGPNGSGKSTLMRVIAGPDSDYTGAVRYGAQVSRGFYADDDSWLSGGADGTPGTAGSGPSVFTITMRSAHGRTDQQVRDLLGAFLFRGDDIYKSVHVLSGGERSRLAMLQLLLHPHNLLVLDEPTNHLDMSSKDVLLDALRQFTGTIVFVSHDREFIEALASRVVELRPDADAPLAPSVVSDFPGDYHYYAWRLEHRGETVESGPTRNPGPGEPRPARASRTENSEAQLSHDEQKALRSRQQRLERAVEELLAKIEREEERHRQVQHELADPKVYGDGEAVKRCTAELRLIEKRIARLTDEWDTAAADLESLAGIRG